MKPSLITLSIILAFVFCRQYATAQDTGRCGPNLTYKLKRTINPRFVSPDSDNLNQRAKEYGELTIGGSGEMTDTPWRGIDGMEIQWVVLPKGLTRISDHAFEGSRLSPPRKGFLADAIEAIGDSFSRGRKEESFIPESVTSIGDYAFSKCSFDSSPFIPNSVVVIGKGAFSGSYIPGVFDHQIYGMKNLKSIGDYAFKNTSITVFTFEERLERIGKYALANNKDLYRVIFNCGQIDTLSEGVFLNCKELVEIYLNRSNLKSIENDSFSGCSTMLDVYLPETLQSIGEKAFYECESLMTVTIPNSVVSIGEGAFGVCPSLSRIESRWATKDNRCVIKDGTLLAFAPNETVKTAVINKQLTSRKRTVVDQNSRRQLTYYSIPPGVIRIGNYTFAGCDELKTIVLQEGVESIGEFAFSGCRGLTAIRIPNTVRSIEKYAFSECENLELVVLPKAVDSVGEKAFEKCGRLKRVYVLNPNARIASDAFPKGVAVTYTDLNAQPPVLTVTSLQFKDPNGFGLLIGKTNCYIEMDIRNDGYSTGSGNARVIITGNHEGIVAEDVSFRVSPGQSTTIRIPIGANNRTRSGQIDVNIKLAVPDGYSSGPSTLRITTQAHGIPEDQLSSNGRKYKLAAESLLDNAKTVENILAVIKEYENLAQYEPYYADAFFNLGKLYTSLAQIKGNPYFDTAIAHFNKFARLVPEEKHLADEEIYLVQTLKKNYKPY